MHGVPIVEMCSAHGCPLVDLQTEVHVVPIVGISAQMTIGTLLHFRYE